MLIVVTTKGKTWVNKQTNNLQVNQISNKPTQALNVTATTIPTPTPQIGKDEAANWKTYINAQWGLYFKYPETWFPQEDPNCCPPGDTTYFYPVGVTPHPGLADEPTNSVFVVEIQKGKSPQEIEQFISKSRQTDGRRVLNVAGKPAISGHGYYIIKLSSTSLLVFAPYNKDGAKNLDTIISTIKFTNE